MARRTRAGAQPALPGFGPVGLALHASGARADALLKERARLLADIQKKKAHVAQARLQVEHEAQQAMQLMGPLVERHRALVRELGELFGELLAPGRLSKNARKQVLRVQRTLAQQGFFSLDGEPEGEEADDIGASWPEDDAAMPWDEAGSSGAPGSAQPRGRGGESWHDSQHGQREVASARKPEEQRRSLRDIFRNLARAVHPDQARHEPERERRTEVMKEVTRAYEEGDLARLVELQSSWQAEQALAGTADPEARCRALERINRELLDQVRRLTRELRDVKRAGREASLGMPLEQVAAQATRELDDFAAVCDFVRKFRDGKSTLSEFARGPVHLSVDDDDTDDLAMLLDRMLSGELGFEAEPAPAGRRKRRR